MATPRMAAARPENYGLRSWASASLPTQSFTVPFPEPLARYLPENFKRAFQRIEVGGNRRILPGAGGFCHSAAMLGEAILLHSGRISDHRAANLRLMRLLFQMDAHFKERLDRRLQCFKALKIPGKRRSDNRKRQPMTHVLKGLIPEGMADLNRFLARGRHAAIDAGYPEPNFEQELVYAIDVYAQQHPADRPFLRSEKRPFQATAETTEARPSDVESPSPQSIQIPIAQTLLFDAVDDPDQITPELKDRVAERFWNLIVSHSGDDAATFNNWFSDKRDDIIKHISKLRADGGPIDRRLVRQTLVHLVADSWHWCGQAIITAMNFLQPSLLPEATEAELSAYRLFYCRNPHLGSIPLVMFHQEVPKVRPALEALLDESEATGNWGRLHTALQVYAQILRERRDADRDAKRKKTARMTLDPAVIATVDEKPVRSGHRSSRAPANAPSALPHDLGSQADKQLDELVAHYVEKAKLHCDKCGETRWQRVIEKDSCDSLDLACKNCSELITVTAKQLRHVCAMDVKRDD